MKKVPGKNTINNKGPMYYKHKAPEENKSGDCWRPWNRTHGWSMKYGPIFSNTRANPRAKRNHETMKFQPLRHEDTTVPKGSKRYGAYKKVRRKILL